MHSATLLWVLRGIAVGGASLSLLSLPACAVLLHAVRRAAHPPHKGIDARTLQVANILGCELTLSPVMTGLSLVALGECAPLAKLAQTEMI